MINMKCTVHIKRNFAYETARFLLIILDISIIIGLMLKNNGGIRVETKRCN